MDFRDTNAILHMTKNPAEKTQAKPGFLSLMLKQKTEGTKEHLT